MLRISALTSFLSKDLCFPIICSEPEPQWITLICTSWPLSMWKKWTHWVKGKAFDVLMCIRAKSLQLYPTLCNPMDCSPPGSSVHGILQARILEWVAIPFSRGSSWPRDGTWVSRMAGRFFTVWATITVWATREAQCHQELLPNCTLKGIKWLAPFAVSKGASFPTAFTTQCFLKHHWYFSVQEEECGHYSLCGVPYSLSHLESIPECGCASIYLTRLLLMDI